MAKLVILPVVFPASPAFSQEVTHHLYLSRPDPTVADEDALRSLVLANIPIFTTAAHIRKVFSRQLDGGLVERVEFRNGASVTPASRIDQAQKSKKKRKRVTAEDLERSLEKHHLPEIWGSTLHLANEQAVVLFVDRPSMEASFKAARKAAKSQKRIVWGKAIEEENSLLGEKLYIAHNKLQYPSSQELLRSTEDYLTIYSEMEEAITIENAKKRQMPDEDGFVTVMKGSKGFVRKEDADALADKAKQKNKGLDNFYRFQMREKRKEEQGELMRKFEEDKRKVEEMKHRRGRLRPD